MMNIRSAAASIATMAIIAGCASPAIDVEVPTTSMQNAWRSHGATPKKATTDQNANVLESGIVRPTYSPGTPMPVVTAPEIRMAYLAPYADHDGVMHYGQWVAVEVHGYRWTLPDGSYMPLGGAPR